MLAHQAAVVKTRPVELRMTDIALTGAAVDAGADLLVVQAQRAGPGVAVFFVRKGLVVIFKASTTGIHVGYRAALVRLQGAVKHRQQPGNTAVVDVFLAGVWQRLALQGNVGRRAQVVVLGGIQRVQVAVGIGNGMVAKTGQAQTLGDGDDECFHADRFAFGGFLLAWLHHRPAGGDHAGVGAAPGTSKAPDLIHD